MSLPEILLPLTADPGRSALFLDFDGTLAAIVDDPVAARPLPGVPALLTRLAGRFALVAVVSGRPTAFLNDVLGAPKGVRLVGLYGLELAGSDAAPWATVIDEVVALARAEAPPGIYVEPKGLTVTLHWRHAPGAKGWVEIFAAAQAEQKGLQVHPGRMELELRPPLQVDKGTVVRVLAAGMALRAAVVFGDDIGDLPAFDAVGELAEQGVAVARVAAVDDESPPGVAARADLEVAGAAGAVALLEALAQAVG